jgi:CRISPR/Cas system endoribonuclease Cas6 (RAMP superfamily)
MEKKKKSLKKGHKSRIFSFSEFLTQNVLGKKGIKIINILWALYISSIDALQQFPCQFNIHEKKGNLNTFIS